MHAYSPLWCKTNFSFLEGASHPSELVETAHRLGYTSLAVTDRDGVQGIVRAHVKAKELGIKLIIGSEVTLDDGTTLVLLVRNREGYANLCRLVTFGRLRHEKGKCSVTWSEVCAHAPGLIALWGGDRSLLQAHDEPTHVALALRDAFGDALYALCARHKRYGEPLQEALLRERASRMDLPLVASTEVLYHSPSKRPLQDVLTCIRHGVTLTEARDLLKPNAEHALKSQHEMAALFEDDPNALARAGEVAARCDFSLAEIRYRYPSEWLPEGMTSAQRVEQLTMAGALTRYDGNVPEKVTAQLHKELRIIGELDYWGYFLTMWEIVAYCRREGILCQGRGSAANSAVCYCLGITAVDPMQSNLLFERFLSIERAEPPDIDLDIEHEKRERVIQYVYEKYTRKHAAMVANVIRYRARSAVREVGKALGISETTLDRFAKVISHWDAADRSMLQTAGLPPEAPLHARLIALVNEIEGFPRHLSIHPGGFLLGHEPVHDLVPIENGSMKDRTVIQWDKDDVEAIGLFKVDLLGLGALTQLHLAFELIEKHHGRQLSMASIPPDDAATYSMIQRGDTVGVFQIESRAQMSMLPRLLPASFYDLVIEISIVRPGPISGGMVHPYLKRRQGLEKVTYPHDDLIPVLEKTKGVPLFQEQVMRVAMVAAGYSAGEADQLRRDMAAWRKTGRIDAHRDKLISGMARKGIEPEFAERIFKQIQGFGEYGFPESHAASFALIAYATSYLRCHWPVAFTCSLLNAQPMGFYSPATIIDDAKRHGVGVSPIDVTQSEWLCTMEKDPETQAFRVRMGFRYLEGLREGCGTKVMEARAEQSFASLEDFTRRVALEARPLSALAECGALSKLVGSRRQALWNVRSLARERKDKLRIEKQSARVPFAPLLPFEQVDWDYRVGNHSTRAHPLAFKREELRKRGIPDARSLAKYADKSRVDYAGMVICRQRPGTAKEVTFMTLEDETGFANVVLWKQVFADHELLARTCSFLGVTGTVQQQDGVIHLIAETLWQPDLEGELLELPSRDFH